MTFARVLLASCHFMLIALACPAGEPQKAQEFSSRHMGTTWRIIVHDDDRARAETVVKRAFQEVARLESLMTDYNAQSELMKACHKNDEQPKKPIPLSQELYEVLAHAQEISEASDGAFDVTVGPLIKLWRTARKTRELPDPQQTQAARELIGYQKLRLDEDARTLTLDRAGMRLDLGGIGKGYAADGVLKLLTAAGYDRALVAASGDISVSLPPPGKESWTIELPPLTEQGKPRFLKLKNQSVSTSGDLYQFVEIEGVRYSHIVDPRTGKPQTGRRSVTVVADRGWKADALTKAMSLLNPEKSLALAKRYKTETLITVLVGDKPRSHATPGWNLLELREE